MRIEHAAWDIENPAAAADWYVEHLRMKVVRSGGPPANARFLADATGRVLLEIYNNPKVAPPDYRNVDPLITHLAFAVENVAAERQRLLDAGAAAVGEATTLESGDVMCMLRDPWGFPLQLLKRRQPM